MPTVLHNTHYAFGAGQIREHVESLRRVARHARANRELKVALEIERGPLKMWEEREKALGAAT
jgi:hypothetical protein